MLIVGLSVFVMGTAVTFEFVVWASVDVRVVEGSIDRMVVGVSCVRDCE